MSDQTDIAQVEYLSSSPGLNPQDLVELGALQATNGMTVSDTRAFVAEVQQLAAQMALAAAPSMLDRIRRIQEARFLQIYTQIRLLPQMMGYISRDRVLAIIQTVAAQAPKQ
jgi:hypothetical protein